ncbi:MAG: site-specific DNA-methyltransferase, partial [Pseudomonadota bacterium]
QLNLQLKILYCPLKNDFKIKDKIKSQTISTLQLGAKMDKLNGISMDIVAHRIKQLKELFPEVFSEEKINFDKLQELLGHDVVKNEDHYHFTWHGKRKAGLLAQTPSTRTLRPCRTESVQWDTTQHLFIEGDNLEVLKLLQKSYHHQVKMIYIDPPYNTGNDFIYKDDFKDGVKNYLELTGKLDSEGKKMEMNSNIAGRYHTNWLNMMYPRLKLARNLLRDDGIIFMSIDDHEVGNLRKISDEIFGEDNFLGVFIVNSTPNARDYGHIAKMHEYTLMYAKNALKAKTYQLLELDKKFKYKDEYSPFNIHPLYNSNVAFNQNNRPNLYYPFYVNPNSSKDEFYQISLKKHHDWICVYPPKSLKEQTQFVWRWGKEKASKNLNKEIIGYKTGDGHFRIVQKMRHSSKLIRSLLTSKQYSSRAGTAEVEKIFGQKIFSFPKPISLIKDFISAATVENDIVLDLFAGSSTTAHSVLEKNVEDQGHRRFMMIQLPENTSNFADAKKAGYTNIADISKDRIRLAAKKIQYENPNYKGDLGFKAFKLDSSNIKRWEADFDTPEQDLLNAVDDIKQNRSNEDVLYEILLKCGLDLTVPIEKRTIAGKTVYSIGLGALVACLEKDVCLDVVNGIGALKDELQPEITRVVFKDDGFKDDVEKTNALQTLKRYGIKDIKSL